MGSKVTIESRCKIKKNVTKSADIPPGTYFYASVEQSRRCCSKDTDRKSLPKVRQLWFITKTCLIDVVESTVWLNDCLSSSIDVVFLDYRPVDVHISTTPRTPVPPDLFD